MDRTLRSTLHLWELTTRLHGVLSSHEGVLGVGDQLLITEDTAAAYHNHLLYLSHQFFSVGLFLSSDQ